MNAPCVVLIGPPGSGKTTVGRLLAATWGVGFRDTDADVESTTGESIAEIFIDAGEARFRELERAAVVAALAEHDGVLALGGGAILDPDTQRDLEDQTVVFLDVSMAGAAPRVGLNQSRPLLVGNPRAQWQRLMDARRAIYQRLATVMVSTDGAGPEEVAQRVRDALAERGEDTPSTDDGDEP